MSKLELQNVTKRFGGVTAVANYSLTADPGEIVGIIGPNGAGKTTVFNLISGIYPADEGKILLNGEDITSKPKHEIAVKGVARTFQNIRLFKGLNCLENVMVAVDSMAKYNLLDAFFLTPRKRREEKKNRQVCQECLHRVGLDRYAEEMPSNLPYGLQRRLEIARALAMRSEVLLLDEPAAGLNPTEVAEITDFIRLLRDDYKLTILLIEHRLELVMSISDRIYVQNFGQIISVGKPAEVQRDPKVVEAYLGGEADAEG